MNCGPKGTASAKRFLKPTVDWAEMQKRVPPEQKTKFLSFKAKSDAYWRRVLSYPEEPPKINWMAYKKSIPIPDMVEHMRKKYEGFKVPYPEDKLTDSISKQWEAVEKEIKAFKAEREKEIAAAEKELARIRALPKFEDMTMEMVKDLYPDIALDPVAKPSYWPHNPEEQVGYEAPKIIHKKE